MKNRWMIILFLACSCFSYLAGETGNFVLVHGAWHGDWYWFKVEDMLTQAGYNVKSILLPGHDGRDPGGVTLQDYTDKVVEYLDSLEQPVILAGHSMGGIVISTAAEIRSEKIEKLIFIAAFLLQDGQSLLDIASLDTTSKVLPRLEVDEVNGVIKVDTAFRGEMFYNTSPQEDIILTENLLVPNPLQPFGTPLVLSPANFGSVHRFYITTTYDQAITPPIQELMYTALPCEKVYTLNTDHSPFFSDPEGLVGILRGIAGEDNAPIINNGEFDEGTVSWNFLLDGKANAVFSINAGSRLSGTHSAEVAVTSGGSKTDDLMLYQDIDALQRGTTYNIGFSAMTAQPGTKKIDVKLLDAAGNVCWEYSGLKLNNTPQSCGPYLYTCQTESSGFRFVFCLGKGNNLTIYLDAVNIKAE